jgi:hypothetical protein
MKDRKITEAETPDRGIIVTCGWRLLHHAELHNLFFSPKIIIVITLKKR